MKSFKLSLLSLLLLSSIHAYGGRIIQVKGSDTIVTATQSIVEEYMAQNKSERIAVTGGGSGVGISGILNKNVDIAMSSRDIKEAELNKAKSEGIDVVVTTIGFDGITIIVNKDLNMKDISDDNLGKIYRGEISNWKEIGGPDLNIVALSRDSSSGTHEFFKEHVVRKGNSKGKEEYGKKTLYLPSNEAILDQVRNNKNTIGYIGMGYMNDSVKSLSVDGVVPTVENVASKKYPIARAVYWISDSHTTPEVKKLINFATSPTAQKIVKDEGFVPVK